MLYFGCKGEGILKKCLEMPESQEEPDEDRYWFQKKIKVVSRDGYPEETIPFYIDRALTAAVLLEDKEAVKRLAENKTITKSPELERAIAIGTKDEWLRYLVKNYPQITDTVRFSVIYDSRNTVLLKRYIKIHYPEEGIEELKSYRNWLKEQEKYSNKILRNLNQAERRFDEDIFFKMLVCFIEDRADMDIVRDIQDRCIFHLGKQVEELEESADLSGYWYYLSEMTGNAWRLISSYMELTSRYGPGDVTSYAFTGYSIQAMDLIGLKYEIKKNFVAVRQYDLPKLKLNFSIDHKNEIKRFLRYAVPSKLKPETDSITEWIIESNDKNLVKYAIKQKYIRKKNAEALLEYACSLGKKNLDPKIVKLLAAQINAA